MALLKKMITELSLQNLPDASRQLWAVFQAFDDQLFVLDADGVILDFKLGGQVSHLPVSMDMLLMRKIQNIFPAEIGAKLADVLNKIRTGSRVSHLEYSLQTPSGRLWFESRLVALANGQIIMMVRDITRHKISEETIKRQFGQLAALRSIDMAITSDLGLKPVLSMILEQTRMQLGVDAASILLFDPQTNLLEFAADAGFFTKALQHTRLLVGEELAGRAIQDQSVVYVDNLLEQPTAFQRSPQFRLENFISYYAVPLISRGQPVGVLEIFHRARLETDQEWLNYMETLAGQAAIAIDNGTLFKHLQQSNAELMLAYDKVIEGWSRALDLRNKETEEHSRRVTELTVRLAERMGIVQGELTHIHRGAMLHDIGKVAIPDSILLKPGPLTDEEWTVMRSHPLIAVELLAPIEHLVPALDIPRSHHEKWNGEGYPDQLSGWGIPLSARIFSVVDVFDALISDRPYRPGWPVDKALQYIKEQSEIHFDPHVVPIFIDMMESRV